MSRRHGLTGTPEYYVWGSMRGRCNNPKNASYKNYGGRGIKVCGRWSDFPTFLADMGKRPAPNLQLDRIDNEGNYEPGNCRWIDHKTNLLNRRVDRHPYIERIRQLQDENKVYLKMQTITQRLDRGWSLEDAVLIPVIKSWHDRHIKSQPKRKSQYE